MVHVASGAIGVAGWGREGAARVDAGIVGFGGLGAASPDPAAGRAGTAADGRAANHQRTDPPETIPITSFAATNRTSLGGCRRWAESTTMLPGVPLRALRARSEWLSAAGGLEGHPVGDLLHLPDGQYRRRYAVSASCWPTRLGQCGQAGDQRSRSRTGSSPA